MSRALACLALLLSGCASLGAAPAVDPVARTQAIGDQFVEVAQSRWYGMAASLRQAGLRYDVLPDQSPAALRAAEAREDAWRSELQAIDPARLAGTPQALARELMLSWLEAEAAARPCRFELWMVSPVFGWQATLVDALRSQPVDTPEQRAQALARIGDFAPRYLQQIEQELREGQRRGYSAARATVRSVRDQLDRLVALPAAKSPLASPGERAGDAAYAAQVIRAVEDKLIPALRAHRDFLRDQLEPAAREEAGVIHNPDGLACYRGALRQSGGGDVDPRALHASGVAQLEAIEREMRALSAKSFGGAPLPALLESFRTEPRWLFKDRDDALRTSRDAVARAWAALPRAFAQVPRRQVVVEPFPAFQEKSSAPRYLPASDDGQRPARFLVRLFEADKQTRVNAEAIAFHEAVPGHHLQFARLQEGTLPRVATFARSIAFLEGWALYAEGLADELGLYTDDAQRMGMLASRAWRAARVVIDTGVHVLGWDRHCAVEFLLEHASLSRDFAEAEVDRYISLPAQATSYLAGWLEITRLRAKARAELGAKLDLRAFHDAVLALGVPSLPMVTRHVEAWIEEKKR